MQSLMWEEFLGFNVDCYMEASPRLLCTKITRGEGSCNLCSGKEFLCSSVVFYIKTGSLLFCTDITREERLKIRRVREKKKKLSEPSAS